MAFIDKYLRQELKKITAITETRRLIDLKRKQDGAVRLITPNEVLLTGHDVNYYPDPLNETKQVKDYDTLRAEQLYKIEKDKEKK